MTPALVFFGFEMCVCYLFSSYHVHAGVNKFRSDPDSSLKDEMRRLCGPRWETKTAVGSTSDASLADSRSFQASSYGMYLLKAVVIVMTLEHEQVRDWFEGVLQVIATFRGAHVLTVGLAQMIRE